MAYDVVVVGGGPAGVVTANRLARQGYRIALLAKPRRTPAVEGLSERALVGLRYAGCERALERIGPAVRRLACWNGERFSGNQEWLIERRAFDAALLEDARAAGVEIVAGRAGTVRRAAVRWRIPWVSAVEGTGEWPAGFLIDARGRAAPHGRDPVRRGPLTIALGRFWKMPPGGEAGTQVAAFPEGWAWFARDTHGAALLQLVVSAVTRRLPPRAALTEHYQDLLATVDEAGAWISEAKPLGGVFARYAQPQFNPRLLADGYARVGDAAFAIDPLSGHGVYEAIGGGLALAATVNTLLSCPQNTELAERFYRERITGDFLRMARVGRDFYRQEQRWAERPFWRERRHWPDDEPAHAAPEAAALRVERRPVNVEGCIDWREVIVTADHPRGIWQVAGIPLVGLLREWRGRDGGSLVDFARAYAERYAKPLDDCRTALAWLAERRLLESKILDG
jgi:flavin-dependent dehydrogenase